MTEQQNIRTAEDNEKKGHGNTVYSHEMDTMLNTKHVLNQNYEHSTFYNF